MGTSRILAVCATALACGLVSASNAHAVWSSPFTVARPAYGEALATSARHGAIFVWADGTHDALRARRLGVDGTLGPAMSFSGAFDGDSTLEVGVARSGAAVLVWSVESGGDARVFARRIGARGKPGRVRTVAVEHGMLEESFDVQLGVDGAGNATIAWHRVTGFDVYPKGIVFTGATVRLRRFRADGSLGPVLDVGATGRLAFSPRLAVAASGRAAITWIEKEGDRASVRAELIRRDGRLGTARDVGVPYGAEPPGDPWGGGGEVPAVGVDPSGRATIAWMADYESVALRRLSRHRLGPVHTLSTVPGRTPFGPQVAVDPYGTATVGWRMVGAPDEGFMNFVEARQLRPDESLGPLRTLSAPYSETAPYAETSSPRLAADGLGRTTAIWTTTAKSVTRVQVRTLARDGRPGPVRTLARYGWDPFIAPQVVGDHRGVVTAAWTQTTKTTSRIRAARLTPR